MLIMGLLEVMYGFLSWFFGLFPFPPVPDSMVSLIDQFTAILVGGIRILGVFVDLRVVSVLAMMLGTLILIDWVWNLVMWIMRKIPFTGIT